MSIEGLNRLFFTIAARGKLMIKIFCVVCFVLSWIFDHVSIGDPEEDFEIEEAMTELNLIFFIAGLWALVFVLCGN